MRSKKLDRKNERYEQIIESWLLMRRNKRMLKIICRVWREWTADIARERRLIVFCEDFYNAGLKRRGVKAFKLFA